jgi:hypothetical protein
MSTDKLNPKAFYHIDFDKITKAEDIVAIMAAVNYSFVGDHPRIKLIEHLLDKDNAVLPPPEVPNEPIPSVELPRLKKVDDNTGNNID